MNFFNDIYLVLPECYLITTMLSLTWLSVLYTTANITIGRLLSVQIGILSLFTLVVLSFLYWNTGAITYTLFGNSLIVTEVAKTFLFLVILGLGFIILLSFQYVKLNSLNVFEFYIILLLILIGFILLLFSNDFLTMYMGVELQSLGLYILATLKQNSIYATEAGLKYFVLGAFASCILILGISIIYSFTGLINFSEISLFLLNVESTDVFYKGIFLGMLFIFVSFIFKVGGAPFHVWLPDVYEGVSTLVTTLFALVPKIVIFNLMLKISSMLGQFFVIEFQYIFIFTSFLSILVGSIGALYQTTIKRLLSYSAIGHTGFILLVLSISTLQGIASLVFYIIVYYFITLNIFTIILQLQQRNGIGSIKYINNFNFIYKTNKMLGISLVIIFFSIAGIPPFSGFFSKLFVFLAAIQQQYFFIAFYTIFLSVIASVYYLKVIRNIMISKVIKKYFLLYDVSSVGAFIVMYTLMFNIFFIIFINDIYYYCINLALNLLN